MDLRHRAFDLAFRAAALTGASRWAAPFARGQGVIFTLHRVVEPSLEPFQPNRILEVSPGFLDSTLTYIRQNGIDLVDMDEALSRLTRGGRFFAALTFDDGFRDSLDTALPILRRHGAPATVYCVPGFAERSAPLWWVDLEEAIRRLDHAEATIGDVRLSLPCADVAGKQSAFGRIYWALRALPEPELRSAVAALCAQSGHDSAACCARLCLDWEGLKALAADPLITIGAHTLTHPRLATLPESEARAELAGSRQALEARLGVPVRHAPILLATSHPLRTGTMP